VVDTRAANVPLVASTPTLARSGTRRCASSTVSAMLLTTGTLTASITGRVKRWAVLHGTTRADTPDDPDELAVAVALVCRAAHTPS
jgi:hypothetical protein